MKKIIFISVIFVFLPFYLFSTPFYTETELFDKENVVTSVRDVGAPFVKDGYIVFTAHKSHRFVGISFDFEQYTEVHSFERLMFYDMDYNPMDSILFYLCEIPPHTKRVHYRLIIDGLWTHDPENSNIIVDTETNIAFSYIDLPYEAPVITKKTDAGFVHFVYEGTPGENIRLAGSFSGWDPYIYQLEETRPGFYELHLHLPPGTHYYTYYRGFTPFVDEKNPDRAYTDEGRVASVIYN